MLLGNDNKLRYHQSPAHMQTSARCSADLWNQGDRTRSRPVTLKSPARHSGGGVLFSHNSHTHTEPTQSYTTTHRDLIHDPMNWKASFAILSSRNELWHAHFTKKVITKRSLCEKKAQLFQIQRKDDLCWTHDTMLLMTISHQNTEQIPGRPYLQFSCTSSNC